MCHDRTGSAPGGRTSRSSVLWHSCLMLAFRIADRRFPIFDGSGARLIGGRWNSPGHPVIYTAETFAGALLEILAHSNLGRIPTTHSVIEVKIPTTCRGNRSMRRKCWDGMQRIKLQAAHAATTG